MARMEQAAWQSLVDSTRTEFAHVVVPTGFWNNLRTARAPGGLGSSGEMNALRYLRTELSPHVAAEGKAEMLERVLGGHTTQTVGRLESKFAEELRRGGLTRGERVAEDYAKATAWTAEHSGYNSLKSSVHGAGKVVLIGGAAAAGVAVLAGLFGGKKKQPDETASAAPQQPSGLPTADMMLASSPQPSMGGITPSGNMPGSQVNISEMLANKGGPQFAMGV